jgi:vitamin B12 transporter
MKKFARFNPSIFIWLLLLSFGVPGQFFAQADSLQPTVVLPEAIVQEPRYPATGFVLWKADSLPVPAVLSLASRLYWENGLLLRLNAPGTLATLSARGAGASRTAVLWNGLNLQSPMNGVVDASLLPIWPGDQLQVQPGGNSAAQSAGAMGGAVLLETPLPDIKDGINAMLGTEAGTFGYTSAIGALNWQQKDFSGQLRGHWQQAENNFPFQKIDLNGKPYTTRQPNNFGEQANLQQFNHWAITSRNTLKTAVWYQQAYRQIPPTTTEAPSETWQRDRATRAVATWTHTLQPRAMFQTRLAWQEEYIAFRFAGVTEVSKAQTVLVGTEWQCTPNRNWHWRAGTTHQLIRAKADGYRAPDWYRQHRLAAHASATRQWRHHGKILLALRQEYASGQAAPFTGMLGWEWRTGKQAMLHGHFSRNFNLPTFNDRFWKTLTQTDLQPEHGFSSDFGWKWQGHQLSLDATAFYLILDDWILWLPGADGVFRPGNLRKVSSKGLEGAIKYNGAIGRWQYRIKGHVQWSATINEAVYGGAESVLHKQLLYTPQWMGGGGLWVERSWFSAAYLHQYTGKRFVTTDNKGNLPGFQTGSLLAQYHLPQGTWRGMPALTWSLSIENLWDVSFESLLNRPMPGRSGRVGCVARF